MAPTLSGGMTVLSPATGSSPAFLLGQPLGIGNATITVVTRADGWQGSWVGQATAGLHVAGLELTPRYLLIQDASGTRLEPLDTDPGLTWARLARSLTEGWGSGTPDLSVGQLLGSLREIGAAIIGEEPSPRPPGSPGTTWLRGLGRRMGRRMGRDLLLAWWMAGMVWAFFFPGRLAAAADALARFPARALGWGSLLTLLLVTLIAVLAHSLVGLVLLPAVGAGLGLLLVPAGLMAGAGGIAARFTGAARRAFPLYPALLSGVCLLTIWAQPLVGGALTGLLTLAGTGGFVRSGLAGLSENAPSEGGT